MTTYKRPTVSVVMPNFNRSHLLRKAVDSVRAQTYPDWELVVVDNFSTDDSLAVLRAIQDPRIKVFQYANGGIIGRARNWGIRHATGEYVAFLDSDDEWRPEKLEVSMKMLESYDLICHGITIVRNDVQGRNIKWKDKQGATTLHRLLYEENFVSTSTVVARKSMLLAVGMFSENPRFAGFEDMDLWIRMLREGARFRVLEEPLTLYRIHNSNFTSTTPYDLDAALDMLKEHHVLAGITGFWGQVMLKRRSAQFYYAAARRLFLSGDRKRSIKFFLIAIRLAPGNLRYFVALLEALFLPRSLERILRKV